MPLNATVQRGFTATAGTPVDTADLNAGFLPTVTIEGSVGSSDLGSGSTNSTHIVPGPIAYVATTGSANAYVAAPSPALAALTTGSWLALKANHTNTGAATLNVNGLGAVAIRKQTDVALEAGDLRSGQVFWVTYDGTYWQLTSPGGLPRKAYGEAAGSTNAYTLSLADIVPTLAALTGRVLLFKSNAANTGACTLNVNSLGATAIKKLDGTDPSGGDIPNAKLIAVAYDGTNFQLLGGTSSASLPDTGVTAGAYATPSSVTVDAKGRITAITAGTALTPFSGTAVSIPAAGAAVTPQAHSFGTVPRNVDWVLVNVTGDAGYTTGQEVPLHDVGSPVSGTDDQVPCFAAVRDATNLGLVRSSAATTLAVAHASTGAFTTITEGNWQVKPYAIK
jgi:hypothetical protein